jgi:opacity protein-like surface antigen
MKTLLGSVSCIPLLALLNVAATAADVEQPSGNWTGFHIGVGAGYGMTDHELNADIDLTDIDVTGIDAIGPIPPIGAAAGNIGYDGIGGAGALATIEAGYDYQFHKNYVLGLQVGYTRSGISTDIDSGEGLSYTLEATDTFDLLARGGHVVDDSTLMYMIGGWTRTSMNASSTGADDGNYDFALSGFTFGSGVETAFADNLTAKIEYRYTQYGDKSIADSPGLDVSAKSDVQTLRAVLSYHTGAVHKFNGDFSEADWSGFHAGIGGGAGMMLHDLTSGDELGSIGFSGLGGKGFFGTVELGADYQFGERFVVGVMGDYTRSNIATSLDVSIATDIISGSLAAKLEAADSYSALARAGVLSSPNVLWYGLAGWTRTTFEGTLEAANGSGDPLFKDGKNLTSDGLTVGVGVESKLNERFSWKTEYRLTAYESQDLLGSGVMADSYMQTVRSVLSVGF